jgi:hypothetical protein
MTLEFRVIGVAIPKGSTKAFGYYAKNKQTGALLRNPHGKPILLASTSNANPKTKGWQQLVADAASKAMQALPVAQRGLLLEGYPCAQRLQPTSLPPIRRGSPERWLPLAGAEIGRYRRRRFPAAPRVQRPPAFAACSTSSPLATNERAATTTKKTETENSSQGEKRSVSSHGASSFNWKH